MHLSAPTRNYAHSRAFTHMPICPYALVRTCRRTCACGGSLTFARARICVGALYASRMNGGGACTHMRSRADTHNNTAQVKHICIPSDTVSKANLRSHTCRSRPHTRPMCTRLCAHTCACTLIRALTRPHARAHARARTHARTHARMRLHMCLHTHLHMRTLVRTRTCTDGNDYAPLHLVVPSYACVHTHHAHAPAY